MHRTVDYSQDTPLKPQPDLRVSRTTFLAYHGKHALIIEDNALNAEILMTLLANHQITTTLLETPRDLDTVLATLEHLDLIFLDLEFHGYDGFETQQGLRQRPDVRQVPVIAYSVHTSEMDRARRAGFHSFLGKPLKPEQFESQLARILNNQNVWDG